MSKQTVLFSSFFSLLWLTSMLCAVVSGFLHLPLAVRYGLVQSWYSSPSVAHYRSAAALLLLGTYALMIWRLQGHNRFCLTRCGLLRILLLSVLAVTGIALVVHNMPDYSIYGSSYTAIKLLHLASAIALLPLLIFRLCQGWRGGYGWLRPKEDGKGACLLLRSKGDGR